MPGNVWNCLPASFLGLFHSGWCPREFAGQVGQVQPAGSVVFFGLLDGNMPTCLRDFASFVEYAAIRAGKGKMLVCFQPATLQAIPDGSGLHEVVPEITVYCHVDILTQVGRHVGATGLNQDPRARLKGVSQQLWQSVACPSLAP